MTDEQTAAAIVAEHRKSQHLTITEAYKELEAAIVRALQAAREEGRKSATPVIHNVEEFYRETTSDGK